MTQQEKDRLLKIRVASKRGQYVASEDYGFAEKMAKKFPNEYRELTQTVNEMAAPFGANILIDINLKEK